MAQNAASYCLTFVRPVAQLRVGIDLLQDKWETYLGLNGSLYPRLFTAKVSFSTG